MSAKTNGAVASLGCTVLLLMVPFSLALNGLVFRSLWAWFAVPQFHLAPVSVPMAVGLSELVGLVVMPSAPTSNKEGQTATQVFSTAAGISLGRPLLYLLIGYLVHLFL